MLGAEQLCVTGPREGLVILAASRELPYNDALYTDVLSLFLLLLRKTE